MLPLNAYVPVRHVVQDPGLADNALPAPHDAHAVVPLPEHVRHEPSQLPQTRLEDVVGAVA